MYDAIDDPYCYRGTTVLKNRAGLRSQIELDKLEAVFFTMRAGERPPAGKYTQSHYRAVHRHLFGDVYRWAGRYRSVRISKGESTFCYPENITPQMDRIFGELADQNQLRDLEKEEFARGIAHFLTELNAIHPFREGNGRTQNVFLLMLASQAGHPLDFERVDPKELVQSMIAGFHGREEPLMRVILAAARG